MNKMTVLLLGIGLSFGVVAGESGNSKQLIDKSNYAYCQGITATQNNWCYASKGIVLPKVVPVSQTIQKGTQSNADWLFFSK
jgi:hypothetical protein